MPADPTPDVDEALRLIIDDLDEIASLNAVYPNAVRPTAGAALRRASNALRAAVAALTVIDRNHRPADDDTRLCAMRCGEGWPCNDHLEAQGALDAIRTALEAK